MELLGRIHDPTEILSCVQQFLRSKSRQRFKEMLSFNAAAKQTIMQS